MSMTRRGRRRGRARRRAARCDCCARRRRDHPSCIALADDGGVADHERIVDVVVDALADPDERLAPAADPGEIVRQARERAQRAARSEPAFGLARVLRRRIDRAAAALDPVIVVDRGHRRRRDLLPHEPVDRREEPGTAIRELLAAIAAAARRDHGDHVVGADESLDELTRRRPDPSRAPEVGLQVVEHQRIARPLAPCSATSADRILAEERRVVFRSAAHWEKVVSFRLAVLRDQSRPCQAGDELPLGVGDDGVDLDVRPEPRP